MRTLGDSPGHAFHGNQWTGPSANDDAPMNFDFASQAGQFPKTGEPGISYQREHLGTERGHVLASGKRTPDREHHVDILLHRDQAGKATGVLYHYPTGFPDLQPAGSVNLMVDPKAQRQGIATKLYQEGLSRFKFDPQRQDHTAEGRKFVTSLLKKGQLKPAPLKLRGKMRGASRLKEGSMSIVERALKLMARLKPVDPRDFVSETGQEVSDADLAKLSLDLMAAMEHRALGDIPGHEFHGNQFTAGDAVMTPDGERGYVHRPIGSQHFQVIRERPVHRVEVPEGTRLSPGVGPYGLFKPTARFQKVTVIGNFHRNDLRAAQASDPALVATSIRLLDELKALGGPGSGNFGHAGRPGEVGGSAGEGSSAEVLSRPASAYPPSRPDGRDTQERFSDGHGRYTPERQVLHDAIIQKYMRGTTPVANPVATILGGGPASGKSTLVNSEGIGKTNTVLVDVDSIRTNLPEYVPDANGRLPSAFTHEESSDIAKQLVQAAVSGKRNVLLDGTGDSSLSKLGGKVAVMRSGGHEIVAEYVTTSIEIAHQRAEDRGLKTGRYVPPTFITETHKAVSNVFPEALRQGLFDRARLFDTSSNKAVLVASAVGSKLTVHDHALWHDFTEKGKKP